MRTKRQVVLQVFYHCKGGQTALVIRHIPVNLFRTGDVPSQLSGQEVQKRGVQGAKAVDITVGDNFVHWSA